MIRLWQRKFYCKLDHMFQPTFVYLTHHYGYPDDKMILGSFENNQPRKSIFKTS